MELLDVWISFQMSAFTHILNVCWHHMMLSQEITMNHGGKEKIFQGQSYSESKFSTFAIHAHAKFGVLIHYVEEWLLVTCHASYYFKFNCSDITCFVIASFLKYYVIAILQNTNRKVVQQIKYIYIMSEIKSRLTILIL